MTLHWQDESFNKHVIALHIQNLLGFTLFLIMLAYQKQACNCIPSITKLLERATQQKAQSSQNPFREKPSLILHHECQQ